MSNYSQTQFPIGRLIYDALEAIGLSRTNLVRRLGYSNVTKGLRRLDGLCQGETKQDAAFLKGLAIALELSEERLMAAIAETKQQIQAQQDAAWRSAFQPHAIILTERSTPRPLFLAAYLGADRLLRIDFDLNQEASTFIDQARATLAERRRKYSGQSLPAFGQPKGLIVNYSCDRAVQFDLCGNPQKVFDQAYRLGQASLLLSGREVTSAELSLWLGSEAQH